jgi:hypothetical protein
VVGATTVRSAPNQCSVGLGGLELYITPILGEYKKYTYYRLTMPRGVICSPRWTAPIDHACDFQKPRSRTVDGRSALSEIKPD